MSGYTECEYCFTEFYAQRSSAKYCGDSCKSLANRKRRADEHENEINGQSLDALNKIMILKQEKMLRDLELSKASVGADNLDAPESVQKKEDASLSTHIPGKSIRSKSLRHLKFKNKLTNSPIHNKGTLITLGIAGGLYLLNQVLDSSPKPVVPILPTVPENK